MRLSNQYSKPCLIIREGADGFSKGSARNPNGSPIVDLKEFYSTCPYVEWSFGHANAHGTSIKSTCVEDFINWFNDKSRDMNFNENSYQVNFVITPFDKYAVDLCMDIASHEDYWGGNNP